MRRLGDNLYPSENQTEGAKDENECGAEGGLERGVYPGGEWDYLMEAPK